MNIPLPFPYCDKCKEQYPISYHHKDDCHGLLEIDPDTETVYCKGCGASWNIWNSRYYCSCGNVFDAKDVKNAVNNLIEDCKLCAEELEIMALAKRIRKQTAKKSQEAFVAGLLNGLGYSIGKMAGQAFGMIMEFIKTLMLGG